MDDLLVNFVNMEEVVKEYMANKTQNSVMVLERGFTRHLKKEPGGVKGFLETLHQKESNFDRVSLVHEKLDQYKVFKKMFDGDGKTDLEALGYKEKGNKYFSMGKYNKALKNYTKMIVVSKQQVLLAIGYGNRSAALFKLGLYEECLKDIERALANNHPEKNKQKLFARKQKATELLEKSKSSSVVCEEPPKIPRNQRNSSIQYASKSIEIRNDKTRKYIVATKDIQVGDIILVEPPLIATIGPVLFYHCHHCFKVCYNVIPCDHCTQTMYCSEECKQNALFYHKDECPILFSLWMLFEKNPTLMLALKMTLSSGIKKGKTLDELVKLGINLDIKDKQFHKDMLGMVICAALLYDFTKSFSQRFTGPNGKAAEEFFKEYILTCLVLCSGRAVPIDELCPGKDREVGIMGQETFAYGIYPLYSLFRHSCAPNVFAYSHGVKRVVRAIRTIKEGEECLVSFGAHYTRYTKEERQNNLLNDYSFSCTCRACEEDWSHPTPNSTEEDQLCRLKLQNADAETVKRIICDKIVQVKELETFEPRWDLTCQTKILQLCWEVLANKRLIQ